MFKSSSSPISMPVLDSLKSVFQHEFGSDFSKLPNRHNTVFVIVQHGFVTIEPMMEALLELGVPPRHVFMTTKPHTTPKYMEDYFLKRFGDKNYIPFQWRGAVELSAVGSHYKALSGITHKKLFKNFYDFISSCEGRDINNVIICDEGGKFLSEFIHNYHNPDSSAKRNLNEYHVVAIEHTKCGTYNSTLRNLPFPLILMADSYLKTQIESEIIAKSMFEYLVPILEPLIKSQPMTIGVVGFGNIGREVLSFLMKNYPGVQIRIYDNRPDLMLPSDLLDKDRGNVLKADISESPFSNCNVILGCTGVDITEKLSHDEYGQNQFDHIHLISCSSGDIEFQTLLQQVQDYKFESLNDICDYTIELGGDKKMNFTIYNGGFPINFLVKQPGGIPAEESALPQEIQITRSMKLAALVQALQLLEVIPYFSAKHEKPLKEYIKLDIAYQWVIIQAFYRDLMQENVHKKMNVVEKSSGIHQPNMSSILNIPYYVSIHNQIEMQNKLGNQEPDIKTLVIHGTAGSGKTTLARHCHHKRKIQFPEHLTRIILAETLAQWKSSLREWAEESQSLRDLLKAEQDSERQEHLIKKHLREQLKSNEWCVVIDNWDENEVGFENIEEIFSNIHQNNITLNKGVLLITTQSKSPYLDPDQSLDLSDGLSLEESRTLMMNIINVGETSINFGSEEALQFLIVLLDRLPLALVIAASYLRWENESRGQSDDIFTYEKYIEMLAEPVSKLDAEYDKLKGKGLIPRDLSQKEFCRIKTQEAAVDLSLKKAIQIESDSPNTHVWKMLCFCGFLASDGIPNQLLKECVAQILPGKEWVHELVFRSFLQEAQKYSLLQLQNKQSIVDGLYSLHIHRVIQKVIRDKYWPMLQDRYNAIFSVKNSQDDFSLYMQKILITLLSNFLVEKLYDKMWALLPHAEEWHKNYLHHQFLNVEHDIHKAHFQDILAMVYSALGDYAKKELNNECLTIRDFHDSIKTKNCYEIAISLYEKSLSTKIAYYDTDVHVSIAVTQFHLARLLLESKGELEKIVSLLSKCEQTYKMQTGSEQRLNKIQNFKRQLFLETLSGFQYKNIAQFFGDLICKFNLHKSDYHNIAGAYHLLGLTQNNMEYFNKTRQYFDKALMIENAMDTQVEYANFLRERGCYSEAILLLDEALAHTDESSGGLSYGPEEAPALPPALAEKIADEGEIVIDYPQFLAYYLKIECLVAVQASTEEIEACLIRFTNSLMNFYQTNSEVPLYDWLLENAYSLQERADNVIAPLPFFATNGITAHSTVTQGPYNP